MKHNDHFTLLLPNNKKLKFKTKEAFSHANEVIALGRYANINEMYQAVKKCMTGFEYAGRVEDIENKEAARRFNVIDVSS